MKFLAPTNLATALIATIAAASMTACGGSSSSTPSSSFEPAPIEDISPVEVDDALRAELPDDVQEAGTLIVATNAPFPPYLMFESESDQTITGVEADLGHALGNRLGIEFDFQQQPFPGLIPGLQSGKYDLVMATMFDSKEREVVTDFVNWSASGTAFMTPAGNPADVTNSASLCGNTAGVESGSFQQALVKDFNAACEDEGAADIEVKAYPQFSDALLALNTGQIDALVGNIPTIAYAQSTEANADAFELVIDPEFPEGYESSNVGIAMIKGSDLAPVLQKAVQSLMDDGTYTSILKKWSVEEIAIDAATINGAEN